MDQVMKILHTSDLHLGRQFNGIPLDEDHAVILEQIAEAITEHNVDALIIAGDIFDRRFSASIGCKTIQWVCALVLSEPRARSCFCCTLAVF